MIVLNLFVGVMLNGLEEARKEQEMQTRLDKRKGEQINFKEEFAQLEHHLREFTYEISERLAVLDKLTEKTLRKD
jgi:glucose-6-phosphate isomerase